jgi:hypothetical protein
MRALPLVELALMIEAGIEANYFGVVFGAEVGEAAEDAAADDGFDEESPIHGKSPDIKKPVII